MHGSEEDEWVALVPYRARRRIDLRGGCDASSGYRYGRFSFSADAKIASRIVSYRNV